MYQDCQKYIFKITVWLVVEIILNLMGLDDLADYSEFLLNKKLKIAEISVIEKYICKQNTSLKYSNISMLYET